MKKFCAVLAAAMLLAIAAPAHGFVVQDMEPEGCQVFNPAQPTCSFTVTHEGESPVSGIFGWGDWVVKIKVGKKTEVFESPAAGEPTVVEMSIPSGAKVSMEALSPGAGGTVGHVDP